MSGVGLLGEILITSTLALLGSVGAMMAHHKSLFDLAVRVSRSAWKRASRSSQRATDWRTPGLWRRMATIRPPSC